jgi:hypothetical protein
VPGTRRWPWAEHGQYLDRSIVEIRRELNIKVIKRAG